MDADDSFMCDQFSNSLQNLESKGFYFSEQTQLWPPWQEFLNIKKVNTKKRELSEAKDDRKSSVWTSWFALSILAIE